MHLRDLPCDLRLRGPHRRSLAGAALAAAALVTAAGCAGSEPAETRAHYQIPPEKARDGETVVQGRTGRSADTRFTVLGLKEGMTDVMGTHAAMDAEGAFTRIRILAVNTGRDIQVFDTWKQRLLTADGRTHSPDVNATMIKRQPERFSVGSAMRVEFDLWFDVPRTAKATAVRLYGSPPVGAVSDPAPAEIPLR